MGLIVSSIDLDKHSNTHRHYQSLGNRASTDPVEHCIREFKELTEQKNAHFSVVLFPSFIDNRVQRKHLDHQRTRFNKSRRMESQTLNNLEVDYIEVRDIFSERGLSLESHRNVPNDLWHPNNDGQDIIGQALGLAFTHLPPTR